MTIEIERTCSNCANCHINKKVCKKCDLLETFYLNTTYEDVKPIKRPLWKMDKTTKNIVDNPSIVCFIDTLKVMAQTEKDYKEFKYYSLCVETLLKNCDTFKNKVCSIFANRPNYAKGFNESIVYDEILNYLYNIFMLDAPFDLDRIVEVNTENEYVFPVDKVPSLKVSVTGTLAWEDKPFFKVCFDINLAPLRRVIR